MVNTLTVAVDARLRRRLDALASELGCDTEELAAEALRALVATRPKQRRLNTTDRPTDRPTDRARPMPTAPGAVRSDASSDDETEWSVKWP